MQWKSCNCIIHWGYLNDKYLMIAIWTGWILLLCPSKTKQINSDWFIQSCPKIVLFSLQLYRVSKVRTDNQSYVNYAKLITLTLKIKYIEHCCKNDWHYIVNTTYSLWYLPYFTTQSKCVVSIPAIKHSVNS